MLGRFSSVVMTLPLHAGRPDPIPARDRAHTSRNLRFIVILAPSWRHREDLVSPLAGIDLCSGVRPRERLVGPEDVAAELDALVADPHVHAGDDTDVVRTLPAEAAVGSLFRHRVRAYVAALRRRGLRSPRDFVRDRELAGAVSVGGVGDRMTPASSPSCRQIHPRCFRGNRKPVGSCSLSRSDPGPITRAEVVSLRARKRRACRDTPPRGVFGGSSACHEKVCPPWKCGANIAGSCWSLGTKQPRYWECGATRSDHTRE